MSPTGSSESRGTMTVEQLIGECFVKTAQTVLSSRVHEPQTAASKERSAKRTAWFKLEIQEIDSAREALDRWRAERGVGLPLVLEIYLQPIDYSSESTPGTLLERWTLRYSPGSGSGGGAALPLAVGGLSRSQMARFNPQAVYKRLTLLVRAIYTYCRVLPAYRLARAVTAAERAPPFRLAYRLHSTLQPADVPLPSAASPGAMLRYRFAAVETAEGQLTAAVEYSPRSSVMVMGEAAAAVRIPRPAIIQDYVRGGGGGGTEATVGLAIAAAASLPKELEALSTTPRRRGWSSSFRHSPARSYEPPLMVQSPRTGGASPRTLSEGITGAIAGSSEASTPRSDSQASSSLPRSASTPARALGGLAARPPLPPFAPRSFEPGAHSRPVVSSPGAGLYAEYRAQGAEEDAGSEEEEEASEGGRTAGGLASRRISPPVKIPGASAAHRRRPAGLRSSGDLGALGAAGADSTGVAAAAARQATKPLSAPAVSHMPQAALSQQTAATGAAAAAAAVEDGKIAGGDTPADARPPSVPPTPLGAEPGASSPLLLNPPSFTESAASSSGYPASCSPDLPFAFTPTARYSCSPASATGGPSALLHRPSPSLTAGSSGPSSPRPAPTAGLPPSPPPSIRGREIPAGTALMRRASWGARSGASVASAAGGGEGPWAPGTVGYSVSPLQDGGILDSVLSASTPRHLLRHGSGLTGRLTHTSSTASGLAASGGGTLAVGVGRRDSLMLTYHAVEGSGARAQGGSPTAVPPTLLPREESEQLPFDFYAADVQDGGGSTAEQSPRAPASDAGGGGAAFAAVSSAAAVGAFVRLVREAPPLARLEPVPLETGIGRLATLRERLAVPAAAAVGGSTQT